MIQCLSRKSYMLKPLINENFTKSKIKAWHAQQQSPYHLGSLLRQIVSNT